MPIRYGGSYNDFWCQEKVRCFGLAKFPAYRRSADGGYVPVEPGEKITLYVKRNFQHFYNYSFKTDVYYVEREGAMVYNNLNEWKGTAFAIMCFAGGLAFFLFLIFLDQSKNISLEVWFQRRVLMNKNYRK